MSDYKKISKFLEKYDKNNNVEDYKSLCWYILQKNKRFPAVFVAEYGEDQLKEDLGSDYARFQKDHLKK